MEVSNINGQIKSLSDQKRTSEIIALKRELVSLLKLFDANVMPSFYRDYFMKLQ